jgi:uncharacterized protein YPO0396
MPTLPPDFTNDDAQSGFRLHRFEVLNWGTFTRRVWAINPDGHNALLTGDIGSGKSTLVDAVTTLLVPHHRIVYNKAAGAVGRERDLYSYIRGEYKSEKDDYTQAAKAIPLRGEESFTVLLAHFHNAGLDQGVSLAQVFWLKDKKRNPERFFVVAETPLSIAEHFSDFGNDPLDLKKRLKRLKRVTVLDNFKEYGSRFRHLFGIQNEQALELFYQTVSMKSVGNLTDFVRNHMLESADMESRIDALRRNFDNLNRAHEAVLKAKNQIERLVPLVADGERYAALAAEIEELRGCREVLAACFAAMKVRLLTADMNRAELEMEKTASKLASVKEELIQLRRREGELVAGIDDSGGRRLQTLADEIALLGRERDEKLRREEEYRRIALAAGLKPASSEEDFFRNRRESEELLTRLMRELEESKKAEIDLGVGLRALAAERDGLAEELDSLRRRTSNIPLKNLTIRREMAGILGVGEAELPFAGELLQVDDRASAWEGAIERLLHSFGLSLLVPEALYGRVSHYVEATNLRGRLVYYRARDVSGNGAAPSADPDSLARKVLVKPDTPFYGWLLDHVAESFDYTCCEELEMFRRLPRAITRNGQIKSGGQRHEKDDRRSILDRSQYVLGWSNKEKIRALESKKLQVERTAQKTAGRLAELNKQQHRLAEKRDAVRDLLGFADYGAIRWEPLTERIQILEEERAELERSSDSLKMLREQLQVNLEEIAVKTARQSSLDKEAGRLEERLASRRVERAEAETLAATLGEEGGRSFLPKLDGIRQEAQKDTLLTLQNHDRIQRETRELLQARLDALDKRHQRLVEKILGQMKDCKHAYPAETVEMDAGLEALPEFASMLKGLQEQDLPRHEARFKQLLNEETIKDIVLLQNQLEKEKQQIIEKIRVINGSLRSIEYSPGTFIELVTDRTTDPEVRDFQQELKQCLSHTLSDGEIYSEAKFLQVKAIIDRFNGREGFVELDRRWSRKVTDVRNWFAFSASERWLEDNNEKEYYSDTAGKSGGQKEKLAYTILASALAYQFGLEWGAVRSRSFRFVVIDEAFAKGSDESSRYGLELFRKLNLQLLIVTPLQKIHIIEEYINSVHYVYNENGADSMVRNLALAEYRAEKERYRAGAAA